VSTIHNLTATMADGSSWDVQADQRDISRFEAEPFGLPFYLLEQRPFLYIRYMAWSAGRRPDNAKHALTWEQFQDQCVEVRDRDRLIGEKAAEPDPGNPVASAGN
jgi:hypothetical protein